ncbi:MAG: energy-coupling factor ABC transporter ATP-binding protein [Candidatus Sigynarchaeota archaeon]
MIEFQSVSYQYPDGPVALHDVNIRIDDGSFVAVLGENGAGKTTFVKCINGLLKPTTGEVLVDGMSTKNASVAQMAKKVGLVFQNSDNQLFATSVKEELDFSLRNVGIMEKDRSSIIEKTLATMNLLHLKEKSPFLLSGGERKRVAFASLICMDQQVFIADEPTQGQDEIQRENIEQILRRMQEQKKTVIIITHDLDFITRLADRVVIFEKGRISLDGPVEDVFKFPAILKLVHLQPTQELALKWMLKEKDPEIQMLCKMDQKTLISTIVEKIKARREHVH